MMELYCGRAVARERQHAEKSAGAGVGEMGMIRGIMVCCQMRGWSSWGRVGNEGNVVIVVCVRVGGSELERDMLFCVCASVRRNWNSLGSESSDKVWELSILR